MNRLYLDISKGISGDMLISCLSDLGVDFTRLKNVFINSGVNLELHIDTVQRNAVTGRQTLVKESEVYAPPPLRTLNQILPLINSMDLSPPVREKSVLAFKKLALVEGKVHDIPMEKVHFHEVGAVDTLFDIIGAFWGLERLNIEEVTSCPVPWFRGEVEICHGKTPLPAPATLELMKGKPVRATEFDWEIITPTGALLVDQLVNEFKDGFTGILQDTGLGFGSCCKGFNGLRGFLWHKADQWQNKESGRDEVYALTSNIDHMTGEELGDFFDKIMQSGALDVIYLPGIMKKGRAGGQIQVLCRIEDLSRVRDVFFKYTLTLGIREAKVSRTLLPRKVLSKDIDGSDIKVKKISLNQKEYFRWEMETLKDMADKEDDSTIGLRLKSTPWQD
ncbi:LarC family nickel insertion protein [Desulfonatronovibrio magnus]|uniref:LarC family nickel insertion protein n=1 Tax=Desulfonatronovibrio magnus TaxID=698827 RepID=UPI0005EB6D8D|nr:LarC family nickel insertion protein [Desulfonatronovibrio magnus]